MKKTARNYIFILWCSLFMGYCGTGSAQVYQYQDANGNWVFTDTPPVYDSDEVTRMDGMVESSDGLRDLQKQLQEKYHPENEVDAAAMATVTVTSSIGTGSGFFISDNGYLLTNRHVIYGDERQAEVFDKTVEHIDDQVKIAEADIAVRENQLKREKEILDEMAAAIGKLSDRSSQKKALKSRYHDRLAYYQAVKKDLERQKSAFMREKQNYENEKTDYENKQAVAGVSRNFKITLKNGETLYAYLVRASSDHDLALLKIDGCKTPFIYPADKARVFQRQKVWAIGSPLNIVDTMKDGTVSGFTNGYIQTNAQIYPGNSGGPLVNEKGRVVGINTLKELTRKFEGMGLAIPIDTALEEFAAELR